MLVCAIQQMSDTRLAFEKVANDTIAFIAISEIAGIHTWMVDSVPQEVAWNVLQFQLEPG